jgi:transglutaminase-like putative cysteine protease
MLRILISFVISLALTMSPYLGWLFGRPQITCHSGPAYSSIEVDKPSDVTNKQNGNQNDPIPEGGTVPKGQAGTAQAENRLESVADSLLQDPAAASDEKAIDASMTDSGLVRIRYLNQSGKRMKLLVEKDGTRYTYDLKGDNSLESFPLQSGNGDYTIGILENTEGKRYRYLLTKTVSVHANANAAYLNSVQMIHWDPDMAAIKKAAELTSGVSREEEKVEKIHHFVVSNIRFHYSKLNNLPSTYLPVIDDTFRSGLGICYDFAALTAAMLRSVGIPAKLVMGYAEGVEGYHAWNEVYMEGRWVTIDTSYDSQMQENNGDYSMMKDSDAYQTEKKY